MRKVTISHEIPPIYQQLHDKFGVEWNDGLIIAYDNIIYSKNDVAPQKVVHEVIHLDRQKELGVEAWYRLYLESDQFRLEEEIIAYVAEANFVKKNIKDRELRFHIIHEIAKNFSSDVYGSIISFSDAIKILR